MNYISLQDYRNAILLALAMEQPGRLHTLFKTLPASSSPSSAASITGHPSVDIVIRTLSGPDLAKLLRYVRDWNASARTSTVAQRVLHAVVKLRKADEIIQAFDASSSSAVAFFPGASGGGDAVGGEQASARGGSSAADAKLGRGASALRELVEALVPYTERHLARMEKLVQESYVVDYLLEEMDDGLFGVEGEDGEMVADEGPELDGEEEEWEGMEVDVGASVVYAA